VFFVAQSKIFRARWSNQVHDEWVRNLIKNRPDLKESDLDRGIWIPRRTFPAPEPLATIGASPGLFLRRSRSLHYG
jgi:hypothetical protein